MIPKTSNPDRSAENFACTDFQLSPEETEKINALDCGARGYDSKVLDFFLCSKLPDSKNISVKAEDHLRKENFTKPDGTYESK